MAKFMLVTTRNKLGKKRWRWNLVADNGESVATSEQYNSRDAALNGVFVVKELAAAAQVVAAAE